MSLRTSARVYYGGNLNFAPGVLRIATPRSTDWVRNDMVGFKDCVQTVKFVPARGFSLRRSCQRQLTEGLTTAVRFRPIRLFLSESMADARVEIRFTEDDKFSIIYRNYAIATVDAIEGKLIERHIRRL